MEDKIISIIMAVFSVVAIILIFRDGEKKRYESYKNKIDFDIEQARLNNEYLSEHSATPKFDKEKFGYLYSGKKYGGFLLIMIETIRRSGNAPKLEEYNYPISEWVSKHSIDPIYAIPKWFEWIETFRKDNTIFSPTEDTYNVRVKADKKIREFVGNLESTGQLVGVSDVDGLSESIFIKASMDNLLDMLLYERKK